MIFYLSISIFLTKFNQEVFLNFEKKIVLGCTLSVLIEKIIN